MSENNRDDVVDDQFQLVVDHLRTLERVARQDGDDRTRYAARHALTTLLGGAE